MPLKKHKKYGKQSKCLELKAQFKLKLFEPPSSESGLLKNLS